MYHRVDETVSGTMFHCYSRDPQWILSVCCAYVLTQNTYADTGGIVRQQIELRLLVMHYFTASYIVDALADM